MNGIKKNVFSYQKNSQGQYFPIVPVTISYKLKKADTSALIDSGATISIFKEDVADLLGIKIENGEEIFMGGVGGRIKGYLHKLDMEVASKKFKIPVIFSYEYLVSLNLLGRDTFFPNFSITFTEKDKIFTLG